MDSVINYNEWYKLDNAAKIFPAVSTERNANVFRICAHLKETVDPVALQKAVNTVMPRFPSFSARLRRGFFWYFLDHNPNELPVRKEPATLYKKFRTDEERGFLMRVFYYNNRISLEMFHSLSDGYGGIEFLKALLYHYLEAKNLPVKAQGKIKTANSPYRLKELEDSFFINYEKSKLSEIKDEKAFNIPGVLFIQEGSGLISGECDAQKLSALAKEYGCTVGEFITAVYIDSLLKACPETLKSRKPIIIFVPVNLRRFFNSQTLRNFSSFVKVRIKAYKNPLSFEEIVTEVKSQMKEQLTKEALQKKMSGTVAPEKILFFRLVPLFIKTVVLRIFYNILGEKLSTSSLSNLGKIDLPQSMTEHIDKIEVNMGATGYNRINVAFATFNNKFSISFTRSIMETDVIKTFFDFFKEKIDFFVTSNSWEEENRIPDSVAKSQSLAIKMTKKAEKDLKKSLKVKKVKKRREK